jgi:outer membrane protein assembly factor BamE|tara:strand:- start:923 stop:1525 length:603 start_codon:yes stop_codon:yes gene_type:complete
MLYYERMQIKTYLYDYFLIFLLFNLISCSSLDSVPEFLPKVYKIDIQQGNAISSEMLMKLKPGMTKAQVRFVLGTPLIKDTFHKERWDYVYVMRVKDIVIEKRHVVLNFVDELLKNITGEVIPKKDNNEIDVSSKEKESTKPESLPLVVEDKKLPTEIVLPEPVDTSESINEAIKQDIIDSLPEKDDAGYFDILLEKIGF